MALAWPMNQNGPPTCPYCGAAWIESGPSRVWRGLYYAIPLSLALWVLIVLVLRWWMR